MDDSLILKTIADNIRIERLRKRLSQEKLAEIVGISTKYLNMIENNKTNPTIVIVVKICNALKIDLNTLIKL
ncbi:MAG: helix-turn-helix transcriptional regulator [Cyanobacteriota bacterium]|jgi:transcriptional regulator with XRE-family HTH domain|nr:helix-turn-helix transcriptional regulator [Cyanobacteriota bacterium]